MDTVMNSEEAAKVAATINSANGKQQSSEQQSFIGRCSNQIGKGFSFTGQCMWAAKYHAALLALGVCGTIVYLTAIGQRK